MKRIHARLFVISAAITVFLLCAAAIAAGAFRRPGLSAAPSAFCGAHCSLMIEPDDGIAPFLSLISHADRAVDLVSYQLKDPAVITALASAVGRGVAVKVLLDGSGSANDAAFAALKAAGAAVRRSPDYFVFTHEKAMIVDDEVGLIMSFNLVPKYYPTGRDFGVIDTDAADVSAMREVFDSDWEGRKGESPPAGNALVWSPGSRAAILALIRSASRSLEVYNEEMADDEISAALEDAARRGIAVDIVMTAASEWKAAFRRLAAAGAAVYTYPDRTGAPYIHAKMVMADGSRAFVGSENFSETSFDRNRELGVMVDSPGVIAELVRIFDRDRGAAERLPPG